MAITVVASVTKAGAASGGTTTAIDTTGATLLVVSVGWFSTNPITVTDSKGNTWVPLTRAIASTTQTQLFFCLTPTVGSGHTFTVSGTTIYPAILVAAFAGVVSVQIDTGATSTASPCTAGPVTPLQSGALVVTSRAGNAASTDSVTPGGFTLLSVAYGAGTTMRGGLGYVIQTTAAAITPTWTWTGSPSENASTTAVFLPGAAPAPALVRVQRTPAVATTTAATTSVLTFATPPTVGHAIVVVATGNHATTLVTAVTDNYGNTYSLAKAQGNASGPRGVAVWFCQAITATGASFTVTVTGTSVQRLGVAIEISGVGVGLVLDQTAGTGAVGAASTTTGATAALTGNDHLVVAGAGIAATLASLTMTMASPHWTQEGEALTSTQSSELDSGVVIGAAGMTLRAAWSWPSGGAHAASAIVAFSPGAPVDVTVPDVVGETEAAADTLLVAAGLVTGTVTTAGSATVAAGLVISQSPTAGSEVAPGSAVDLVISSGPAAWKVFIEGVDQTALVDRFDVSMPLNDRARATVTVGDLLPERFDEVLAYAADGVTPLFGGVILQRQFMGRNQYDPTWQTTLECGDWMTFADWCFTSLAYTVPTLLKDVLTDLVDTHLAQYDITLADDQVDGPSLAAFTWTDKRVSDALRELSGLTGYVVHFTPDKTLEMFEPGSRDAVFDLSEAAPHSQEVSWRDPDTVPYNKVTLTAGPTGTAIVSYEQHAGDGATRMWVLDAPWVQMIGALHIFSEGAGGYPVGMYGVDDMPYTMDLATNAIRQRVDQTLIAADDFWYMSYLAQFPIVVTATTGATPVIELVATRPEVLSTPVAQEIADALLAQAQAAGREATIRTDHDDDAVWTPGEALTIDLPTTRQLEGEFLLTSVGLSIVLDTDQGDRYWQWTLEATEGTLYAGSYLDGWRRMIRGEGAVTVGEPETPGGSSFLGGSRGVSVSATPAAYQPVVNFMTYDPATDFTGRIRVDLWALNVGIGATARFFNFTDSVSVGTSATITSTTAVSTSFVVDLVVGKRYRLEVIASADGEGVFCIGSIEFIEMAKSVDIHCDVIRVSTALYERTRTVPLGVWQPYAAVWTATGTPPTLGNGTLVAHYALVGMTCHMRVTLTIGATTVAGTGTYRLSLPFVSAPFRTAFSGTLYRPRKTEFYLGAGKLVAVPSPLLEVVLATPSGGPSTLWGAATPSKPEVDDQLTIAGGYEIGVAIE